MEQSFNSQQQLDEINIKIQTEQNEEYFEDHHQIYKKYERRSLNEPVKETVKIKYVMMPIEMDKSNCELLKDWDLWGPLLLCLQLALTLSIQSTKEADIIFGMVFVLIWLGAFIVTLNAKLLKANISFFQSVSLLGYSIFPINLVTIFITVFKQLLPLSIKFVLTFIAFIWSTYASTGFIASLVAPNRKYLAIYPIFLFYLFISWYAILI